MVGGIVLVIVGIASVAFGIWLLGLMLWPMLRFVVRREEEEMQTPPADARRQPRRRIEPEDLENHVVVVSPEMLPEVDRRALEEANRAINERRKDS